MQKMIWLVGLFVAFAIQCGVAAAGERNDCYPTNSSVILNTEVTGNPPETGPTFASGEAERTLEEIEVNRHGILTDLMPVGGAEVEVEFKAAIDATGKSTGRVKIEIHWNTPLADGTTETEFESGCVEEIETRQLRTPPPAYGEFEGEYEGTVENFPGYPGTSKAAVASIQVVEDADNPGKLEVDVSIELGYTCFENVYATTLPVPPNEGTDIEFEKIALKGLDPADFNINNTGFHGRRSLPDQRSAGACE
jgi:hypothetical protein